MKTTFGRAGLACGGRLLGVAGLAASTLVLTACDDQDTQQIQRWSEQGWAVYADMRTSTGPLYNTFEAAFGNDASTRFVDAANGSNGNPGTRQAPWATLAHAASRLKPDQVTTLLLKCGTTFHETLALGENALPPGVTKLRLGSYGDNCSQTVRPTISGADPVKQGWVVRTDRPGVYARPYTVPANSPSGTTVYRMFHDGLPLRQARHPDHVSFQNEYLKAEAVLQGSSPSTKYFRIAQADLAGIKGDLKGARVYVRTVAWQVEGAIVDAYDPGTGQVTLDRNLTYAIATGAGYYLEGKDWMLDGPGEWHYDTDAKRLSVRLPGNANPNAAESLEATVRMNGVQTYLIGIEAEGIRVHGQARAGFDLNTAPQSKLMGVQSLFAGRFGIVAAAAPGFMLAESQVVGAGSVGVRVVDSDNANVIGNHVSDTNYYFDLAPQEAGSYPGTVALSMRSPNGKVQNNIVTRSAGGGVHFLNRPGIKIERNTVVSACQRFSDCGAINTFKTQDWQSDTVPAGVQVVVADNLVTGVGASNQHGNAREVKNQNVGIYLDELSSRIDVTDNTVVSSEVGIYLHKARFNRILRNKVRGVTHASFKASMTNLVSQHPADGVNLVQGNEIRDNQFFSHRVQAIPTIEESAEIHSTDKAPVYAEAWEMIRTGSVGPETFFTGPQRNVSEGNVVTTLSDGNTKVWQVDIRNVAGAQPELRNSTGALWAVVKDGAVLAKMGRDEWRTYASSATDDEQSPVVRAAYKRAASSELMVNGAFANGLASWSSFGGGAQLALGTSEECGIIGACAKVTHRFANDQVRSASFQLEPGEVYLARYMVGAGSTAAQHRIFTTRLHSPYGTVGLNVRSTDVAAHEVKSVAVFFRANSADTATILLQGYGPSLPTRPPMDDPAYDTIPPQPPVYFGQFSLQKAVDLKFLPEVQRWAAHIVNSRTAETSVPCEESGLPQGLCSAVDEQNAPVQWPLKVPARGVRTVYLVDPWSAP